MRHAAVLHQNFGDLLADLQDRIERCHRFLKDHANAVAADFLHGLEWQRQEVLTLEIDPAGHPRIAGRQKPHDRHGRDALAGTGFTDDGDGLLRIDVEADIVDDIAPFAADAEGRIEV